jgi:hypothetical protein
MVFPHELDGRSSTPHGVLFEVFGGDANDQTAVPVDEIRRNPCRWYVLLSNSKDRSPLLDAPLRKFPPHEGGMCRLRDLSIHPRPLAVSEVSNDSGTEHVQIDVDEVAESVVRLNAYSV